MILYLLNQFGLSFDVDDFLDIDLSCALILHILKKLDRNWILRNEKCTGEW